MYIGKTGINQHGEQYEVLKKKYIERSKAVNYLVRFPETGQYQWVHLNRMKNANFRDFSKPCISVVGYAIGTKQKPLYLQEDTDIFTKWSAILERCYNVKNNCYKDVIVADEWHCYNNFKDWYLVNSVPGVHMAIDKDLFAPVSGCKIYSSENCCLLPIELNSALVGLNFNSKSEKTKYKVKKFQQILYRKRQYFKPVMFNRIADKLENYFKKYGEPKIPLFNAIIAEKGKAITFTSKQDLKDYVLKNF